MTDDNEEIIDDPLTDTQKRLRAIVVDAVREVIAEERRRFDWLKFTLFVWDQLLSTCNQIVSELQARLKRG